MNILMCKRAVSGDRYIGSSSKSATHNNGMSVSSLGPIKYTLKPVYRSIAISRSKVRVWSASSSLRGTYARSVSAGVGGKQGNSWSRGRRKSR